MSSSEWSPPPPGPPLPPSQGGSKKVQTIGVLICGAIVALLVVLGVRHEQGGSSAPYDNPYTYAGPQVDVEGPSSHQIVYYLTGSAVSADLTLQLGAGGSSQQQGVDVPLMNKNGTTGLRFPALDGDFLYISAQNNGSGTLHCRITEDGLTVDEQTSSGEFAIVTCEGSA